MPKKKRKNEKREVYHVEVITKARVLAEGGGWEYFVKWAGYSSDADSWEPSQNVAECDRLLKSFWAHVGVDNEDYDPGYVIEAKPDWIAGERKFFADQYSHQQKEETRKKEKTQSKKPLNRSNPNDTQTPTVFKGKQKMKTIIISDSDESVDTPLIKIKLPPQKRKNSDSSSPPPSIKPPRKILKTNSSLPSSSSISAKGKQKELPNGTQQNLASPTSLFSETSSPDHPKANPSPAPTTSIALPKVGSTSKGVGLPKRQNEPLVKLLPIEDVVTGGSSLSTKQRIAQGSSTVEKPKHKIPAPPTKSLSNLNFKKTPSTSDSTNRVRETEAPTVLFQTEQLSSPDIPNIQLDAPLFSSPDNPNPAASPEDFVSLVDYDPDPFSSFNTPHEPGISPILRAPPLPVQTQPDNLTEADAFLNSMKPSSHELQPPRIPQPKPAALPRIQKKWKWTGELFIDVDHDKAEKLCDIVLTDTTDYLPEGLRLNILFSALDSVRFGKLHDLSDLDLILLACKPAEQVARVGPQDDKDAGMLKGLANHMHVQNQVAFMPLFLDDFYVAILLVFTASMKNLCHRFNVPKDMQQGDDNLLVTLIPWAISAAQKKKEWRKPYDRTNSNKATNDIIAVGDKWDILRSNPTYCRALRTLNFPKKLHEHMSLPNRPYCIWCAGGDGTTAEPGLETTWLISILNQCRAKNLGLKADVRVMFIHVGAMKTLHNLPALVERRSRRSEIQFYMYGTHETVTPERWGIREIFPVGGIVTFTPSAIVDDPIGVYKLIGQLAKHPLWDCYVLPSVVGMVTRLAHGSEDPLSLFDKGEFGYDDLLMLIERGHLSLLQAPRLTRNPLGDDNNWIGKQLRLVPQTRGLLGGCVEEWAESYSNRRESEWSSAIEMEISKDLTSMQLQPAVMDEFRRFVVIKAPKDDHISWNQDGFEWVSLSKFDFRDDYFVQPEQNGAK